MNNIQPLVSIVITTKNEEKNIENCLISIQDQTYNNIEIIVVDNNSSDKTKALSRKYTNKVFNKGPERSSQRNYGMLIKSKGRYTMFVDADMVLGPYLIEDCVKFISNNKNIALHIPEVILGTSYFSKVRRFERSFYNGTVIDGARFFYKEKFQEVGGFDESMSGPEDWDIDKKIKQIGCIGLLEIIKRDFTVWTLSDFVHERGIVVQKYSNVIFHNEADIALGKYLKKKAYYASNFDIYLAKWGKNDKDISMQFGFWYRYMGVFLEKGKFIKLLSHPILTSGMCLLRFLVGVTYILKKGKFI
jgi:glycosyltransferase involved in cell wall biosynthesis